MQHNNERTQSKAQKREKLSQLLINKFRNKFHINSSRESYLDQIVIEEVSKLLESGHAYESNLYKLDRKLDGIIEEMRKKKAEEAKTNSAMGSQKGASNRTDRNKNDDTKSMRSQKSNYSQKTSNSQMRKKM